MNLRIKKSNVNDNDNNDDDGYSDTSDEATFEVQRCIVHINKGEIQLPDDVSRFPDRSCFIHELNEILSRFENYLNIDLTKTYLKIQQRIQASEDWTHVDDQNFSKESNDEPSQALT
jgi:hypothetical protein